MTATDEKDRLYGKANRGDYIFIAAPGVDIVAPALKGGYDLSSGTSMAAAHVSGVVALLLERDAKARLERRPRDSVEERAEARSLRCG